MVQAYSYIRTRGWLQEGASGMNPASQQMQLRKAGVPRDQIHRDVGTTSTQERGLAPTFMCEISKTTFGSHYRPTHTGALQEEPGRS